MLHFARADAECQRAKCAVRAGVASAAHDGHTRLRRAQFRPDNMDDALFRRVEVEKFDAKLAAIVGQRRQLQSRNVISQRQMAVNRGHIMVCHCQRQIGPPHRAPCVA